MWYIILAVYDWIGRQQKKTNSTIVLLVYLFDFWSDKLNESRSHNHIMTNEEILSTLWYCCSTRKKDNANILIIASPRKRKN